MSTPIPSTLAYRLNYQDGMFLTAEQMALEQSYVLGMTALQNQLLFTPGVLTGLLVTNPSDNTLNIEAGAGFDEAGDFVVLPQGGGNVLSVPANAANPSTVYLVYPTAQQAAQNMPANTLNMAGIPQLLASAQPAPANSIVLAEISLSTAGGISAVTDKRVPVTSRLPAVLTLTSQAAQAAISAQFLKAASGRVTVPVESLPTATKAYVQTVYYLEQKTQAFSAPPKVVVQAQGSTPYPTSVSDIGTTHFTLTIGGSTLTPDDPGPLQLVWWALP